VIAQGGQGFDMLVVAPPAAGDDMVVEVGEAAAKVLDPSSQLLPLLCGVDRGERRPVSRGRDIWEVIVEGDSNHVSYVSERVVPRA
jgi:hypothetical protein